MNSSALFHRAPSPTPLRVSVLLAIAFIISASGCQSVFLTGRQQFDIMPEKQEIALGAKAYAEVLQTEPQSQNAHLAQMVDRVGKRLAAVSERTDFQWEFTLLRGPSQNAFCLPGGKVAIYEGILPVCSNEAGLAVVMSHEIAHALARHGGERMTQDMATQSGEWTLGRVFGAGESRKVESMKTAYGLGTKYGVLLPFSRTQESEADSIGLLLMARAGYDPQEAPRFWERFSLVSGPKTPELLSTHPSDETRAAKLKEVVPRALSVYQSAPQRHGLGEQIPMQALAELAPKPAPAAPPVTPAAALAAATPAVETPSVAPPTAAPVPTAPAAASATTPSAPTSPGTVGVTAAPAPVVQAAAAAPAPDVPATLPDLGAPTVEGTPPSANAPVPDTTSPPASPDEKSPAVTPTTAASKPEVPAVNTPAAAETKPAVDSAPETVPSDKSSAPPVLDESNGWLPYGN